MPKPKSDTRARIIGSARTLLRRHGYHGTGLAQIIEHSGAPRGSVYFLFPGGKEEVAVEAVNAWCGELDALIRGLRAGRDTARAWVQALVAHFAGELAGSGFTEGLPVTTITLDSVPASPALTAACRSAYDTWLRALVDGLVAYGSPVARAEGLATVMLASMEGAAVLCRAYGSLGPLERALPFVLDLLPA